jgi:uncharacterized protein (TIGR03382 family)
MFRSIRRIGLDAFLFVLGGVGATSTSAEAMPRYLTISPSSVTVEPGASQTFTLSGTTGCCAFTWTLVRNRSGGTITGAGPFRAIYSAGMVGGVIDEIQVTQQDGERATATVTVNSLVVSPSSATLPPLGSQVFAVSGGSGEGYTWAFATNASSGSLTAAGAYKAGPEGDVSDVLRVTDSIGNSTSATVRVTSALTLSPECVRLGPLATQRFNAQGGSGTGFVWAVVTNASGGEVSPDGLYTAGTADGTDVVGVTDALGAFATAKVSVSALRISPSTATLAPKGIQIFAVSGGSGTGYVWNYVTNASGGTVNAAGEFQAGAIGDVTDVLLVKDSLGSSETVRVAVTSALEISPAAFILAPMASQIFTASAGSGTGYVWDFVTDASGGAMSVNGVYTAGARGDVTDVLRVTDSLGAQALALVTVTPIPTGGCGATGGNSSPLLAIAVLPLLVARLKRRALPTEISTPT